MSEYDLRVYERALTPIFDWPGCDLVVLFGGYALYDDALASFLVHRRQETGKPVLLHDLYGGEDRPALRRIRDLGFPLFASGEVTARVAGALVSGGRARERAERALSLAGPLVAAALPAELREALAAARRRPAKALLEGEAARLLAHFGMPTLKAGLARSAEESAVQAEALGFPVVLKLHESEVVHKSAVGGVQLDLRSPSEVRDAYARVATRCRDGQPEVRLTPFLRGGLEAIVGARRDPQLGPILLFGTGGVLTELVRDVSLRTLPCPEEEIRGMVGETRLGERLSKVVPDPLALTGAIAGALAAVARLILSVPDVADVEVNPLRCAADGLVALDARVLVGD
jgi:acetyltransferase